MCEFVELDEGGRWCVFEKFGCVGLCKEGQEVFGVVDVACYGRW